MDGKALPGAKLLNLRLASAPTIMALVASLLDSLDSATRLSESIIARIIWAPTNGELQGTGMDTVALSPVIKPATLFTVASSTSFTKTRSCMRSSILFTPKFS